MRLALLLLLSILAIKAADTNGLIAPFATTNVWTNLWVNPPDIRLATLSTNRTTNVLAALSVTQLPGACPECGAPNHHERRVEHVAVYEVVRAVIVYNGQTNSMTVYAGPPSYALRTNIVFREPFARQSPGWPSTPYSVMTNNVNLKGVPPLP